MVSKIKNFFSGSKEVQASTAYMICSVLQKCLSLITLPLFTRILTKEEFGISTVYASTMAVAIIFSTLNLPYGSFSPAMLKFENDREGYVSALNTICILFTGFYFAVYFLFQNFWNGLIKLPTELMVLLGAEMLMSTATHFWMGKERFEYRYKSFVIVTLVISVLGTACSLLAVLFLPNKGVSKVIAHGLVVCVIGFVFLLRSMFTGKQLFNREYWKYALSFNIPLIPYYLSQIIFNESDRLMINSMTGRGDAALYGVAYTLAFVLTFVLNAINNSYIPWLYRKIRENDLSENKKISLIIAAIMAVLLLGIIALAPEIILIVAGKQYASAVLVVPPVSMSLLLLFYSQLFINVEFYYEEKYKLVGASILAAVANVVLNYFGIKRFGFVAAGYTTLISYILFAVCNYFSMKQICREKGIEDSFYDYRNLIFLFIGFAIISSVFTALYQYRAVRLGIFFAGLITVVVMREKLVHIVNSLFEIIKKKKG